MYFSVYFWGVAKYFAVTHHLFCLIQPNTTLFIVITDVITSLSYRDVFFGFCEIIKQNLLKFVEVQLRHCVGSGYNVIIVSSTIIQCLKKLLDANRKDENDRSAVD